jgi:hypothetical protein
MENELTAPQSTEARTSLYTDFEVLPVNVSKSNSYINLTISTNEGGIKKRNSLIWHKPNQSIKNIKGFK